MYQVLAAVVILSVSFFSTSPYRADPVDAQKNYMRAAEVWMDEYKHLFFHRCEEKAFKALFFFAVVRIEIYFQVGIQPSSDGPIGLGRAETAQGESQVP